MSDIMYEDIDMNPASIEGNNEKKLIKGGISNSIKIGGIITLIIGVILLTFGNIIFAGIMPVSTPRKETQVGITATGGILIFLACCILVWANSY